MVGIEPTSFRWTERVPITPQPQIKNSSILDIGALLVDRLHVIGGLRSRLRGSTQN